MVLLQGFVFLRSLVDQTQVGDFAPTVSVGHPLLPAAGLATVVLLVEHVSVFDG